MTLPADLDAWTTALGTATDLHATRDPAKVAPPCLLVGLPEITGTTLSTFTAEVPVSLIAGGKGKPAGDKLLELLPVVLAVLNVKTATPEPIEVGGQTLDSYKITAPVHITQET